MARLRVRFYDEVYEVDYLHTEDGFRFSFPVSFTQVGLVSAASPERVLREACKEIMLGLKDS